MLAFIISAQAQVQFSPPVPFAQNLHRPIPHLVSVRDHDRLDFVLASRFPGRIVAFGIEADTVADPIEIELSGNERGQLAFADLNGDGRPDIVTTERIYTGGTSTELALYLNLGDGLFGTRIAVSLDDGYLSGTPLAFGDINGDGVTDVVHRKPWSYSDSTNSLVDLSNGSVSLSPVTVNAVVLHDLNGDGRAEIIHGGRSMPYGFVSYINLASTPPQVVHLVTGQSDVAEVAVADVNADGMIDILFGAGANPNKLIHQTAPMIFSGQVVPLSLPALAAVQNSWLADVDNDGKIEIWAYGQHVVVRSEIDPETLVATTDTVLITDEEIRHVRHLDVNNDGLPDLTLITSRGDCLVAHGIDGHAHEQVPRVIYNWTVTDGEHACAVVLPGAVEQLPLLLSKGYASFMGEEASHFIPPRRYRYDDSEGHYASGAFAHNGLMQVDIDGDGRMDLLRVTCDHECSLSIINDWTGPVAYESCAVPAPNTYNRTRYASIWDINDDGRLDLFVSGEAADYASGYPVFAPYWTLIYQTDDGAFINSSSFLPGSHFEFHADLDGDGLDDLIVPDQDSNSLLTYRNAGGGQFDLTGTFTYDTELHGELTHQYTEVPAFHGRYRSLPFIDVDGDGHLDMIRFRRDSTGIILYYQRIDLHHSYEPVEWISIPGHINYVYLREILFMDIDSDGDIDLIADRGGVLRAYLNDGVFPVTSSVVIHNDGFIADIIPLDADGDGREDLLLGKGSDQFVVLYNRTPSAELPNTTFTLFPNPSTGTFTLDIGHPPTGSAALDIHDALGRTVGHYSISSAISTHDISQLPSGMYLLRVSNRSNDRSIGCQRLLLIRQ